MSAIPGCLVCKRNSGQGSCHVHLASQPCLRLSQAHGVGSTFIPRKPLAQRGPLSPLPSLCGRNRQRYDRGSRVPPSRPRDIEWSSYRPQARFPVQSSTHPFPHTQSGHPTHVPNYKGASHSGPHLWPSHHPHSGYDEHTSDGDPQVQRASHQKEWTQAGPRCVSLLRLSRTKTDPSTLVSAQSTNHTSLMASPLRPPAPTPTGSP